MASLQVLVHPKVFWNNAALHLIVHLLRQDISRGMRKMLVTDLNAQARDNVARKHFGGEVWIWGALNLVIFSYSFRLVMISTKHNYYPYGSNKAHTVLKSF